MSVPASQAVPSSGAAPTWVQIQALVTPPPLPSAADSSSDDADSNVAPTADAENQGAADPNAPSVPDGTVDQSTVNSILATQPKPSDFQPDMTGEPLTPDQQKEVLADEQAALKLQQTAYDKYVTDLDSSQQEEQKLTQAEIDALSAPPPAPPQPDPNPLQRMAPLLVMAALGGKATKMDAGLMLAASTGVVQGYLQGDAEKLANSQKQYEEAYQQFKDRQEQQQKIFDMLREAYKGQPDADLKALTMAHQMTDDDLKVDQDRLTAQQHFEAAAKQLAKQNFAEADKQWNERANFQIKAKAAQAKAQAAAADPQTDAIRAAMADAGVNFPSGMRSVQAQRDFLRAEKAAHPDWTPQQIAQNIRGAQIGFKTAETTATQVARRQASADAAQAELARPGGLFDQLAETAKKVDLGSSKAANAIELWNQKRVFANKDVQDYITTLNETRTAATGALSRGGNVTDAVRSTAEQMFPDNESYGELQTNIARAKKVIAAVIGGNDDVQKAIQSGQPLSTIIGLADKGPSPIAAPKEGQTSTSKSGRPIIFKNGQWVYADAGSR